MFIDIHTHVQQFSDEDLELLVNNSKNSNIELIIAAGTTISVSYTHLTLPTIYSV